MGTEPDQVEEREGNKGADDANAKCKYSNGQHAWGYGVITKGCRRIVDVAGRIHAIPHYDGVVHRRRGAQDGFRGMSGPKDAKQPPEPNRLPAVSVGSSYC